MIGKVTLGALASLALASCQREEHSEVAYPATLYRNSMIDPSLRIHWATFDANESDRTYNTGNCAMAARVLNSNFRASAAADGTEPDGSLGFWCEPGRYTEKGSVPATFEAEFPTDTQ